MASDARVILYALPKSLAMLVTWGTSAGWDTSASWGVNAAAERILQCLAVVCITQHLSQHPGTAAHSMGHSGLTLQHVSNGPYM